MGTIKPFRIKSFKKINSAIEFKDISLAYGNRFILKNINFKTRKHNSWFTWSKRCWKK